ncbi:MAG TPA: hypothetical protein VG184_02960 [Acidimicrobiales bacterium]|jgi:hypothetical protein|nr:hypothetical protein [Acidimicrobiales bacterium]
MPLIGALAGILVLGGCGAAGSQTLRSSNGQTGTTTSPPASQAAVAAGYMRVDYANASIVVPASWKTLLPGVTTCGPNATKDAVLLGGAAEGGPSCGPGQAAAPTSFARLQAIPARLPAGTPQTINGQAATVVPPTTPGAPPTYVFPRLGVELEVAGPQTNSIVASIGWSTRYLVLHPPTALTVPHGWGTATYQGVTIRLPRSWPLTKVGHAQGEPGCGADFSTPELLEGPVFAHSCAVSLGPPPSVDGVWLQGHTGTTETQLGAGRYEALRSAPTKVFLDDSADPMGADPLLHLLVVTRSGSVNGIDVGLGPDPAVAQAIIASITATGGSRNFTSNPTAPPAPRTATTVTTPAGHTMTTTSVPTTPPAEPAATSPPPPS